MALSNTIRRSCSNLLGINPARIFLSLSLRACHLGDEKNKYGYIYKCTGMARILPYGTSRVIIGSRVGFFENYLGRWVEFLPTHIFALGGKIFKLLWELFNVKTSGLIWMKFSLEVAYCIHTIHLENRIQKKCFCFPLNHDWSLRDTHFRFFQWKKVII